MDEDMKDSFAALTKAIADSKGSTDQKLMELSTKFDSMNNLITELERRVEKVGAKPIEAAAEAVSPDAKAAAGELRKFRSDKLEAFEGLIERAEKKKEFQEPARKLSELWQKAGKLATDTLTGRNKSVSDVKVCKTELEEALKTLEELLPTPEKSKEAT